MKIPQDLKNAKIKKEKNPTIFTFYAGRTSGMKENAIVVVSSLALCSEVVLLSPLLGLDGVQDGFPLGLVALADLLHLLFHLRLQRSQSLSQLCCTP